MRRPRAGWRRAAAAWLAVWLGLPVLPPPAGSESVARAAADGPPAKAAQGASDAAPAPDGKRRSLFGRILKRGDDKADDKPGAKRDRDEPGEGDDEPEEDELELNAAANQVGPQSLPVGDKLVYTLPLTLRLEAPAAPGGLPACGCSLGLAQLDVDAATAPVDESGELRFAVDVRAAADARLLELLSTSGVFGRVQAAPPAATFLASDANALRAEQLTRLFEANPQLDLLLYGAIPAWALDAVDVRLTAVRRDLSVAFTRRYRRAARARFDRKHPETVTASVLDDLLDDLLVRAVSDLAAALVDNPPLARPSVPARARRAAAPARGAHEPAAGIALPSGVAEKGDVLVKYYLKSRIEAKRLAMIEEFAEDDGARAPEGAFLMVPELVLDAAPVAAHSPIQPFSLRTYMLSAQRQRGKSSLDLRKFFADKDRQKRRNKYQVSVATRTLEGVPVGIHLVRIVHDSRVSFYDFYGQRLGDDDPRTFLERVGATSRASLIGTSRTDTLLTNAALRTRYALVKVKPGEKTVLAAQVERTTAGTRLAYKISPIESVDFGRHYLQNAKDVMRALVNAHLRKDRQEFDLLMRDNYLLAVKQSAALLTALQMVSDRVDQNMRFYFEERLTRIVQFDSTNTVVDDGLFFGYDRERRIDTSIAAMSEAEARDLYKAFFLHLEMTFAERKFAPEKMAELYARFLGNRLIAAEIERRAGSIKTTFLRLSLGRRTQAQVVREHMLEQVKRYVQYAVMRAQVYDQAYDFVAAVAAGARARTGDTYLDQVLAAYRRDGFPTTLKFVPPAKPILVSGGELTKEEAAVRARQEARARGSISNKPPTPSKPSAGAKPAQSADAAADAERKRQATALRFGELTPEQVEANSIPIKDLVDALIPHPRDFKAFMAEKERLDAGFNDITAAGAELEGIARDRYRRPHQYDEMLADLRRRLERLRDQAQAAGLVMDAKRAQGYLAALGQEDDVPEVVIATAASAARTATRTCAAVRGTNASAPPARPAPRAPRTSIGVTPRGPASPKSAASAAVRPSLEQSFRDLDGLGFKHDLGYYGLVLALRARGDERVKWAVEALRAARRVGDLRVMAQALLLVAQQRQAERRYEHSAHVIEPLLGPAGRTLDLDVKTQAYLLAADVLSAAGRGADAERVLRLGLDEYEARAGELSAEAAAGVDSYLASRTLLFQETAGSMYECLADVLLVERRPREALDAVERNKGRMLLEIFLRNQQVVERLKGGTTAERLELRDLLSERARVSRELASADPTAAEALGEEARAVDARLAALEQAMAVESRLFAGARVAVPPLDPLLRAIPSDVLVVSYGFVRGRLVAFVLVDGRLETFETPLDARAREDLARLRSFQVGGALERVRARADAQAEYLELMKRMYGLLVRPFENRLQGKEQLVVVPQAALAVVPFSALVDDGGRFLVERVALSVAPNLQSLALLNSRRGGASAAPAADTARRGAAAGDKRAAAVAGHPDKLQRQNARAASPPPPPPTVVVGNPSLDLPWAEAEARQVAEIYGVTPLLREAGTKAAVVSAFSVERLILATHAEAKTDNVLDSYIVVAGDTEDDRQLKIAEIMSRDLRVRSDLVALSACQTAVVAGAGEGFENVGTEVLGLNFTFLYQGAGSVLASLWPVNDQATGHIMVEFHRAYAGGQPAARALRQAQLSWLRQAHEWLASERAAADPLPAAPSRPAPGARGMKKSKDAAAAEPASNESPPGDPSRNPYFFAPFLSYSGWL